MRSHKKIIRTLFIIFSMLLASATLFYSYNLFNNIAKEEKEKVKIFAEVLKNVDEQDDESLNIYWSVLELNKDVPIIITDESGKIIQHKNIEFKSHEFSYSIQQILRIKGLFEKPIVIPIGEYKKQYIYFGYSPTLKKLKYIPFIQILIFLIIIYLGYLLFIKIQESNQDSLWAALSKETAHQLGTPTSSLIAWIDLLEAQGIALEYIPEMKKDIDRLKMVSDRFSNIGSVPSYSVQNIIPLIESTVNYMRNRISRTVKLTFNTNTDIINVNLNKELFIWVIENLLKNGVDAIIQKGEIKICIIESELDVCIDISDTGRGMNSKTISKIFQPGFTTKKRGWGLGLSLTKRIVKHYHNGRIFVKNSEIGKGTTFRIILPKA